MAKDKTKRKLVAVVHADVKGYSRLMSEDDEYTVRTLAANRQEMYRLAELHDGKVVDTAGDGFLIEFSSVVDAVKFSVDFQREMKERNSEIPDNRKMEFRIGVNIGDVIHDGGTIHGDGVNVAARLEGLADPGGICISGSAYDQIEKRLDLDYEDIGVKSVKNIAKPVRTYKVLFDSDGLVKHPGGPTQTKSSSMRLSYLIAAAVVILAIASVGIYYFYFHSPTASEKTALEQMPDLPLPVKPSIAVLPFDNMSGDPKQEYFSNGITEEIITGLSKIPQLFVIARNSSFVFKGKHVDVKEVGRKLGVRYVLEGSIQKQGDRVRITAQLIDAQTGGHVWSERYDHELKDIFALQDEITMKIITAMQVKLTEGEQYRLWLRAGSTSNLKAWDKYYKARYYMLKGGRDANVMARQMYEEAIALAEGSPHPGWYAGLGFTHFVDYLFGWSKDPKDSLRQAYELSTKALTLDESLDTPHSVLGLILCFTRKYDIAIEEGQRAVTLNPNGADAHLISGLILVLAGNYQEAVATLERAMRLNPIPTTGYYSFLGVAYNNNQQYDKAISILKKGLQRYPHDPPIYRILAQSYVLAGRLPEAREAAAEFMRLNPHFSLDAYKMPYKDKEREKKMRAVYRKTGLK